MRPAMTALPTEAHPRAWRLRHWLSALTALALLSGMALANHGKEDNEAVIVYRGKGKQGMSRSVAYAFPQQLVLQYGLLIPGLEEFLTLDDAEEPAPAPGPDPATCDQLLMEFWQAAQIINIFQGHVASMVGMVFFDGEGEATSEYYLLLGRLQTIARERGRANMIQALMAAMGCPNLPVQLL